jgi:hypothetical protein
LTFGHASWGNVPAGTGLPALNPMREIATFLSRSAKLAHQNGHDEEAMARIEDIFYVARMTDEQPTFVGHLVAIGIEATGTDALEQICEDLKITPQTRRHVAKSLLYSVYEDGVDDGGKEHPDDHPTRDLDLVCNLKRPPR